MSRHASSAASTTTDGPLAVPSSLTPSRARGTAARLSCSASSSPTRCVARSPPKRAASAGRSREVIGPRALLDGDTKRFAFDMHRASDGKGDVMNLDS
jgi:hypothetical protein